MFCKQVLIYRRSKTFMPVMLLNKLHIITSQIHIIYYNRTMFRFMKVPIEIAQQCEIHVCLHYYSYLNISRQRSFAFLSRCEF